MWKDKNLSQVKGDGVRGGRRNRTWGLIGCVGVEKIRVKHQDLGLSCVGR